MRTFLRRLMSWLTRSRLDTELAEEMRLHIELRRQSLIDAGMDPRDASSEAQRIFGNVTSIREETRAMWGYRWLDTLEQDLRYGARVLRRAPLFTAVASLSLAIGIGSAVAVFSVADGILFRKLSVRAPDELVAFHWTSGPVYPFESLDGNARDRDNELSSTSFSRAAYDSVRASVAADADVFGFADLYRVNVSVDSRPDTAYGQVISGNYFPALGISPAAGRLIGEGDDRRDAAPVAVLSHEFSERVFGASSDVIGRTIIVNGVAFTIIGITPAGFRSTLQVGQQPDISFPLASYKALKRSDDDPDNPNFWWVLMMGRMKHPARVERVRSAADVVLKRTVAAAKPALAAKDLPRVAVTSGALGQMEERNEMRGLIAAMALVVGIVLLVACANVANLFLARGRARLRELTVRVAIGASRRRVIRQLVTEGLLLALVASALGLALAQWLATALLPALAPSAPPFAIDLRLDWRVGGFTALVATACSLLFAYLPALRATDIRLASGLQESSRPTVGRQRSRLTSGLVIAQVALSMLLLTIAGLLTNSVRNLHHVNPGFNPHNLLLFRIDPTLNGYDEPRARQLYATVLDRLSALPGVAAVTLSSHPLIANSASAGVARPEGKTAPSPGTEEAHRFAAEHTAWRNVVGDNFLQTMEIPLVRGRTFGPADSATAPKVAVVNRSLAKQLFGSDDVIGRRFVLGLESGQPGVEIVGVSADAKYSSIKRATPPTAYLSYRQFPARAPTFEVRGANAADLAPAIHETMRRVEPNVPLYDVRTQDEQIELTLGGEVFLAELAGALGVVVLLLSAIGLYGLMAYSVTRRTSEIGVRMALGARRGAVTWMVLRQSLALVVLGLLVGVPAALAGTRVVRSMLYGLDATDPMTIAAAAGLMTMVCLAAAFFPARRASRVDPIVALRLE